MGAASCGASQYIGTGAASEEEQSSMSVLSSLQESIPDHDEKEKLIVFINKSKNINECESASVGAGMSFNLRTKRHPGPPPSQGKGSLCANHPWSD